MWCFMSVTHTMLITVAHIPLQICNGLPVSGLTFVCCCVVYYPDYDWCCELEAAGRCVGPASCGQVLPLHSHSMAAKSTSETHTTRQHQKQPYREQQSHETVGNETTNVNTVWSAPERHTGAALVDCTISPLPPPQQNLHENKVRKPVAIDKFLC